jgi:hypothetical protein
VFTEISNQIFVQVLVSVAGIVVMIGSAALVSWYKGVERRGSGSAPPGPRAGLAGGEA